MADKKTGKNYNKNFQMIAELSSSWYVSEIMHKDSVHYTFKIF